MQRGYVYWRTEPAGQNFAPAFTPQLTPKAMLQLGVFGGKYLTDCRAKFPKSWFTGARLCTERHDPRLNCFGVNASQSLAVWRRNGWIHRQDPAAGFSGIAATTWAGEAPTTPVRSDAGARSRGTWPPFGATADAATSLPEKTTPGRAPLGVRCQKNIGKTSTCVSSLPPACRPTRCRTLRNTFQSRQLGEGAQVARPDRARYSCRRR